MPGRNGTRKRSVFQPCIRALPTIPKPGYLPTSVLVGPAFHSYRVASWVFIKLNRLPTHVSIGGAGVPFIQGGQLGIYQAEVRHLSHA